jgi:ankyrin repeat protein
MTIIQLLTKYAFGPAIHKAAYRGDLNKMKELLASGANPNMPDKKGLTPLMLATQKKHQDIMTVLISHGADVNAKLKNGFTALFYPCMFGGAAIAKLLIDSGANVNAKEDGNTPLMWSAFRGHVDIVELLLANGADPEITDDTGVITAAQMAIGKNKNAIRDLLKDNSLAQQGNQGDGE